MLKQLSVIGIALLATQANAATASQPFITFGLGQSSYSDACKDPVGNCDDKDTAFRIGTGVALSPMYAVEFTYLNHGESTDTFSGFSGFDNYSLKADTFALQMSANTNVAPQVNLYGKAGIAVTQTEGENTYDLPFFGKGRDSVDDYSTGLILSIGTQYALMPNLMADVQIDYLPNAIDIKDIDFESDITMISLGVKYQF